MKLFDLKLAIIMAVIIFSIASVITIQADEIVRPEEIKSKRLVIYDHDTYVQLARQWREYNDAVPSEYAYANWMYAARYADDPNYIDLLDQGLRKYPANPTLLYLKGMEKHGKHDNRQGRKYLEQAVAFDPEYADPWFSLTIHYMDDGDEERIDFTLRRILESGAINDEVMDYCYNMLVSLDEKAIIITNGDNDTYPIWILTRILNTRPDITVVNRSLLNTDWYPIYIIEKGLPHFINKRELDDMRESIIENIKDKKSIIPPTGPFGDTLIQKIIESAEHADRPVYFARTLYMTDKLKRLEKKARDLGLVSLVTLSGKDYGKQLHDVFARWLDSFRTAGLDSWRLKNSPKTDAAHQLVSNYAAGMAMSLDSLKIHAPELRYKLFQWYLEHVDSLLLEGTRSLIHEAWCGQIDIKEIDRWCKEKGIKH